MKRQPTYEQLKATQKKEELATKRLQDGITKLRNRFYKQTKYKYNGTLVMPLAKDSSEYEHYMNEMPNGIFIWVITPSPVAKK